MTTTVLLGKGELAVRAAQFLAESNSHDLALVVPVRPEPTWTASLADWCSSNGVDHVASGHYHDVTDALDGRSIDLAVSIFYDKIIDGDFIDSCRRIVNLHNGPLPRYRGVSPINWALRNEERTHGVTIHEITPGIDDGPILAQVTYCIYPEIDEVADVYARAIEFGWTLFRTTIPILDAVSPTPQIDAEATYYGRADDVGLGDRRLFTRLDSRAAETEL
ncbi:MAG: formyl transferase [Actinomycetia bacterium]|nr:formyl transferase [Actinomycetes bacterium]